MSATQVPTDTARPDAARPDASAQKGTPSRSLEDLIQGVCAKIAPTWPLDRFIAVNPFWGMVDRPVSSVAATLRSLSGASLLMPRPWYRQAYQEGRLRDAHLQAAIDASGSDVALPTLLSLMDTHEPVAAIRARVVDVVDAGRDLHHQVAWGSFVVHSISQFCAAHFDDGQAQLGPSREGGLYGSWRRAALTDRSPELLMDLPNYRQLASELPDTTQALIQTALTDLCIPVYEQESYLWSLLLDQNGWASWCAFRGWSARLEGETDDTIADLLAIRLAWEWMLHRSGGVSVSRAWKLAMASWPELRAATELARPHDWLLQTAMEIAWREPVIRDLPSGFSVARPTQTTVQAVFCIDVRSEVYRRGLEASSPSVQTLGFAGFFGVPMDYQALGAPTPRPQLPGLLAPRLRATDVGVGVDAEAERDRHFGLAASWKSFKTDPISTFTFVEALGLTYAAKLFKDSLGLGSHHGIDSAGLSATHDARRKPRLTGTVDGGPLDLEARCDLAAGMLRGMSLTRHFARFVLLAGHGSATRNNPHAAGLDCGACCGQAGDVNARVAAALLNEPEVRQGLAHRGIAVPDTTWFLAGMHNTTSDDLELFDLDELPPSHAEDLASLRTVLAKAGSRTRIERARLLGLDGLPAVEIDRAIRARTTDWSQVRVEWGLANNAGFIVAPREHCRHLDLGGRSFLHEYRHEEDEGYAVLEGIMTAPMIVTHWINFQYYASTVDNERYGSGNKVLHNVVGGHLGVFEGNGGDLRIGLPMQSLHDGERWVHEALRLSVFIEAPREAIDGILEKHPNVRALITNGWISLLQLDASESAVYALQEGRWQRQHASSPVPTA